MTRSSDTWFARAIPAHIDLSQPGIYEWRIEGVGSYVGKSRRLAQRLAEYPNNVRKLLARLPYRRRNPHGYRRIHYELGRAVISGRGVVFHVIENCTLIDLSAREVYWIARRGTLNGGRAELRLVAPSGNDGQMDPADAFDTLLATIVARRGGDPAASYVARLTAKGRAKIAQKLGEEAVETVIAAMGDDPVAIVGEATDLMFHLAVLLADAGLSFDDLRAELVRREGVSGLDEKAGRRQN